MPSDNFQVYIDAVREKWRYLRDYMAIAREVKNEAEAFFPRVYVFGSSVTGTQTASSDIDILMVTSKELHVDIQTDIKTRVFRKIGLFTPVEIHFATVEQFEGWYKRFMDKYIEV